MKSHTHVSGGLSSEGNVRQNFDLLTATVDPSTHTR